MKWIFTHEKLRQNWTDRLSYMYLALIKCSQMRFIETSHLSSVMLIGQQ